MGQLGAHCRSTNHISQEGPSENHSEYLAAIPHRQGRHLDSVSLKPSPGFHLQSGTEERSEVCYHNSAEGLQTDTHAR